MILLYCCCIAGAAFLRARPAVTYSRGEVRGSPDVLRKKFEDYCVPKNNIPLENNPFYTCVERVGEKTHMMIMLNYLNGVTALFEKAG